MGFFFLFWGARGVQNKAVGEERGLNYEAVAPCIGALVSEFKRLFLDFLFIFGVF